MELNEQGEYEPVEMQTKADVLTGGIFMLRQVGDGHSLLASFLGTS